MILDLRQRHLSGGWEQRFRDGLRPKAMRIE